MMTDAVLHCANHPDRETTLRCNRCEKPICTKCAVLTPVGYRCRECVRGQQSVFETAQPLDFVVAAVLSAVGAGVGVAVLNIVGFWGFFVAPVAGGALAEVVRIATRRRRARRLPLVAALAGAVGVLPTLVPAVVLVVLSMSAGGGLELLGGVLWGIVYPLVTGGLLLSALYYRLRGIRL
jgi:hypothetical protein